MRLCHESIQVDDESICKKRLRKPIPWKAQTAARNYRVIKSPAELPGLDTKDITVSVTGDLLIIKGEKKKEEEEKDEHHHDVERYYGAFQRSFRLPANVKSDKVEAAFEKGVLKITLPKVEEAKKKEIEVKVK